MSEDLPVIFVSAADVATANRIISELTEIDVSDVDDDLVWQLSNKYYTARVRLRPLADADAAGTVAAAGGAAEAHVVYLAEHECTGEALEARCLPAGGDGGGDGGDGGVRLALCACAEEALPATLRAAARRRGYELVALQAAAAAAPPAGPFPELHGLARAREALHAHVWPGLRRAAEAAGVVDEADAAECAVRAEAFAAALGALQAAAAARALAPRGSRAERRQRADQLLDAFCRALGPDYDLL
ncbi:uncharacterized protein LOC126375232 [Pectinophora gossypiella]|uniref:uncharacterized protein LOC126375232 n=1 Tax=Pectinophora gossypiella TaxID=13191 RepID=UPI00214F4BBE|nr:uncharacterized protein LOC126375232 [Pectinophora gossypiella]